MPTIGYLVPEFPGQTHIFFWREMKKLRALGIEPDVVSTRRPSNRIVSHSWSGEAIEQTTYLFPPKPATLLRCVAELFVAGPFAWLRCLSVVLKADGVNAKGRLRLLTMALLGVQLARIARKRNWKHLHVHSCADAANVALFAKVLDGLPYSLTLHGPIEDYGPNQRQKWTNSLFTIVITQKLHHEATKLLGEDFPANVPIAPMGVDMDRFVRTRPYTPYDGAGPFRIFSCGRINPCKGHEYLIESIAQAREEGLDARLKIAGAEDSNDGSYRQKIALLISKHGLDDYVELLGAVSEEVVQECLDEAHTFALASLHEPLGVVYMEAMAMELPVIATNAGGVTELITNGKDGMLVDPESSQQLTQAILQIAEMGEMATQMGNAAKQRVKTNFHSGVSAETLSDHIFGTSHRTASQPQTTHANRENNNSKEPELV